jgi:hypothetical protein
MLGKYLILIKKIDSIFKNYFKIGEFSTSVVPKTKKNLNFGYFQIL